MQNTQDVQKGGLKMKKIKNTSSIIFDNAELQIGSKIIDKVNEALKNTNYKFEFKINKEIQHVYSLYDTTTIIHKKSKK